MAGVPRRRAAGHERRLRVVRHRILVDRDVGATQSGISILARDALLDQAHQHQVIVGAAGNDRVTTICQHAGHDLGVVANLSLVFLERRLHGFLERDRLGCDDVLQRAALCPGEDERVEFLGEIIVLAREDQCRRAARAGSCVSST